MGTDTIIESDALVPVRKSFDTNLRQLDIYWHHLPAEQLISRHLTVHNKSVFDHISVNLQREQAKQEISYNFGQFFITERSYLLFKNYD